MKINLKIVEWGVCVLYLCMCAFMRYTYTCMRYFNNQLLVILAELYHLFIKATVSYLCSLTVGQTRQVNHWSYFSDWQI